MDNWTWFWSVCLSRYRESDTGQVVGWVLTGAVLAGLTIATILTFGTSAPISGTAATFVVGATKGAWVAATVNIFFQGLPQGFSFENINSWEVLTSTIVGGATGAAGGWMEHSLKGINQTLGGKIGMSLATSYLGTVLEAGLTMESLTALSFVNATLIGGLDVYLSYYIKYEFLINLILEIVDNIVGLFE